MSAQYTIGENEILKDGQRIALYDPETKKVIPVSKLHYTAKNAISELVGEGVQFADSQEGEAATDDEKRPASEPIKIDIPPAPPMDPAAGDKTPAYVAWLRKWHPEKAEELYRNRNVA